MAIVRARERAIRVECGVRGTSADQAVVQIVVQWIAIEQRRCVNENQSFDSINDIKVAIERVLLLSLPKFRDPCRARSGSTIVAVSDASGPDRRPASMASDARRVLCFQVEILTNGETGRW